MLATVPKCSKLSIKARMKGKYRLYIWFSLSIMINLTILKYWRYGFYISANTRNIAAPIAIPNIPTTVVNAKILAANISLPPIAFAIT